MNGPQRRGIVQCRILWARAVSLALLRTLDPDSVAVPPERTRLTLDVATLSNRHRDLAERDAERLFGWRFEPRIVLERGDGIWVHDVDGNGQRDPEESGLNGVGIKAVNALSSELAHSLVD